MTEQWNLQTNLKNKPNAQGTLFSGGLSQMNPAKRYPRGYTPERQRAVYRAMGYGVQDHTNSFPHINRDGDEVPSAKARDMEEVIKRSSVPVEHLKGLAINIVDKYDGEDYGATKDHEHNLSENVVGQYRTTASKRVTNVPSGGVWGQERRVALAGNIDIDHHAGDFTLIHEIGHHASAVQGTEHSQYGTPLDRGHEEGFADAYADQHTPLRRTALARQQQGNRRRGRANYEPLDEQISDVPVFGAEHGRKHFEAGYNASRPMETRVPTEAEARLAHRMKRIDNIVAQSGQQRLF